jgi:sugar lactone lactonase YvrE
VGFEPFVEAGRGSERGALKPWLVGLNALELSADCKTLYFSAFTGRRLYSIDEGDLSNSAVANEQLVSEITYVGDIGMAGHFVLDTDGSLYFMDMEQNAIYRRAPDGRVKAVVVDSRLMWPDTMVIGHDKYLYVTTSQHDRRPEFHDGKELRQQPYGLFRVYVGSQPVRAIER